MTIHGRVKRFAKIAGEMVSLEVVESIAHARLARTTARRHASSSSQQSGESTVLFTTDPGSTARSCRRRRASSALRTSRWRAASCTSRELPLLGSGKTDYVELRTRVTGDEDRRSAEQGPAQR